MAKETVTIDVQVQTKSISDLEKELQAVNDQLKDVAIGSDEFEKLSASSRQLTGELEKVNKTVSGLTLEQKIESSQGAVTALAGGLSATVGTLGLIGVESEAFGAMEEKALSAIAASRGFIDMADGIGKVAKNINFATIKAKIFGITTKQALIATGVGIFVVVLGSMVAYWDDITKAVTKFGESVPIVGKALDMIKTAFDSIIEAARPVLEFLGILPDEFERANNAIVEGNEKVIESNKEQIDILKARGATQEEIFKKQEEMLAAELDNLKRTEGEAEDIKAKAHELTLLRITEETRIRREAFNQRLAQIKLSEQLEGERKALEEEWFATFGDEAAMSFVEAFQKTVEEEDLFTAEYIDESMLDFEEGLFGEDGAITNFQTKLAEALEDTLANKETWDNFLGLANQSFDAIANLSQQRYDRQLLNLQRERDEIINNTSLSEQERSESLARIEKKERDAEVRRIKAERDQFTLKQMLIGLEQIMKAKFYAMEQIQLAKLAVSRAQGTAQEIALAGIAATGKASMSLGAFVAALGPFGIAAFAATIVGVIASIVSARKQASAQIKALGGTGGGGGSTTPSTPPDINSAGLAGLGSTTAPQFSGASPAIRTFVLSGDVTSSQEADAKLGRRRKID